MKFETYVHKIILDHQLNFHKDQCKDTPALAMKCACTRLRLVRPRLCTDVFIYLKNGLGNSNVLENMNIRNFDQFQM